MKELLRRHPHILTFGILQIFFSAPGQTFLISLYVASIFDDLGVSQTLFAGLYTAATALAALLLNPAGRLIDKYPIQYIIKAITISMAVGCFILASAKNVVMIFIGFFILRLIGQGVFSLTGSTLIIKTFEKNRGKAMGIITLGFPFSEAVYPFLAVFLLSVVGWRLSYAIFGISNILLMLPIQLYLIKMANIVKGEFLPGEVGVNPQSLRGNPEERKIRPHKDFILSECLKDFKFYLILLGSCLPPMVVTGLLFHQNSLFESQGWPIALAASGIVCYAITKAIGSVAIGPIVDKYGPLWPFAIIIAMLGLGTYLAGVGGPTHMIFVYFGIIGAALGFSSPVMNVVWPYFYGVKHMGSIKGFIATFRNGVTALGPLPIAMALDSGVSIQSVLLWTAYLIVTLTFLPFIIWWFDK